MGGGKDSFDNIWPLDGKEKTTVTPPSRELWEKIKAKQKTIDQDIAEARLKKKR